MHQAKGAGVPFIQLGKSDYEEPILEVSEGEAGEVAEVGAAPGAEAGATAGAGAGAAEDASGQTEVSIGYTRVIAGGVDTGQHHAFAIARDPVSGEEFIVRGGPSVGGLSDSATAVGSSAAGGSVSASSGEGSSGGFGFGEIDVNTGLWTESLPFDQPSKTVATQPMGTVDIPYGEVVQRMKEYARVTNENGIPYSPLGPNSNSVAFTFLESLGMERPTPDKPSPGYGMGKPDDDLSYYP